MIRDISLTIKVTSLQIKGKARLHAKQFPHLLDVAIIIKEFAFLTRDIPMAMNGMSLPKQRILFVNASHSITKQTSFVAKEWLSFTKQMQASSCQKFPLQLNESDNRKNYCL